MMRCDRPQRARRSVWKSATLGMCMISVAWGAAQAPGGNLPPAAVWSEHIPLASDNYPLSDDSLVRSGVPAGKIYHFELNDSKIFPHTSRTISLYVPASYTGDKPACLLVMMNGLGLHINTVLDNLIAQHAVPVTIAVGVSPGVVPSSAAPENPRFDRSLELDSMNDRFAQFLLQEVLPAVEGYHLPNGKQIHLSANPDDRALAGGSTGGIAAFTVAWQHPQEFHRVFSWIGTFVGMRHGEQYYVEVRKTEPKPLRIFLQDNANDEWMGGPEIGDWFLSNVTMNRALEFAGYDVAHAWGVGTHSDQMAAAITPDVLRWLWRDWPKPVVAMPPGNPVLKDILQPGEVWRVVAEGCHAQMLAADPEGRVWYDYRAQPIEEGRAIPSCEAPGAPFALGASGEVYVAQPQGGIELREPKSGQARVLAAGVKVASFTVRGNGDMYALSRSEGAENALWYIPATGEPKEIDGHVRQGAGVALSPDGLWLFVAQRGSHSGLSYRVLQDGRLDAREPLYDFAVPTWAEDSGASQVAMDRDGRAYVATRLGVQVFDRNGRVTAILPMPGNEEITGLSFGGADFDVLFVSAGKRIYARRMKAKGTAPWMPPIKLPPWGAG